MRGAARRPSARSPTPAAARRSVRSEGRRRARRQLKGGFGLKTTLPTRRLGKSGPEITTVGFGAWAVGGGGWAFAWGPQDDAESVAAIRHAVSRGVNWIDTAAVYGYGHSEEVVREALSGIPQNDR